MTKETGEGWMTFDVTDYEYGSLVSYWTDEPAAVVPIHFEPNQQPQRTIIRAVGAVVLRVAERLYRWVWPWR